MDNITKTSSVMLDAFADELEKIAGSVIEDAAMTVAKNPVAIGAAVGAAIGVAVQYQANKPGKDGSKSKQQKAWADDKRVKPVADRMAKSPFKYALPAAIPGAIAGATVGKAFKSYK
jgi:hypothetical protein